MTKEATKELKPEVKPGTVQEVQKLDKMPVKTAFLQASAFLPGYTETTLSAQRIPGIKMVWIRGEGLLVNFKHEEYFIPDTNVKIVCFDKST